MHIYHERVRHVQFSSVQLSFVLACSAQAWPQRERDRRDRGRGAAGPPLPPLPPVHPPRCALTLASNPHAFVSNILVRIPRTLVHSYFVFFYESLFVQVILLRIVSYS